MLSDEEFERVTEEIAGIAAITAPRVRIAGVRTAARICRAAPRIEPRGVPALAVVARATPQAVDQAYFELYGDDAVCKQETKRDPQWCFDAVRQRPTGGATPAVDPRDQPPP